MSSRACSGALACDTSMAQRWGSRTLRGNFVYAMNLSLQRCVGSVGKQQDMSCHVVHHFAFANTLLDFEFTTGDSTDSSPVSTVLAQDHFYSDFLSSSLTILTQSESMMMIFICCGVESALTSVTGGMNSCHNRFVEWNSRGYIL